MTFAAGSRGIYGWGRSSEVELGSGGSRSRRRTVVGELVLSREGHYY